MSLLSHPVPPRWICAFLVAGLAGCDNAQDEGASRVIGYIDSGNEPPALTLPGPARAGVAFAVTVATFGTPCTVADGAVVAIVGQTADITPYDRVASGNCVSPRQPLPRPVFLTFTSAGTATIRVHGRAGTGGTLTVSQTLTVLTP